MSAQNQIWHLLQSGSGVPAFNMALDEALLEFISQTNTPVLRFYHWSEPAASFGYFQRYAEIERTTLLRPLVRRPTGGGVVPHHADWTYSVVFPANHEWYGFTAKESYRCMHQWIQTAFRKLSVSTTLADCCRRDHPGQCFGGYEQDDVLWHHQKIAGAAQRRNRFGLLIQGSVQPPPIQLSCEAWQKAMCDVSLERGVVWKRFQPSPALEERAQVLAREKYSQQRYTQKR
jgi:lipoyl(octanoyl) transferase